MDALKHFVAQTDRRQVDIAKSEGVSPQAVSKWMAQGRVPIERCARIERLHGVSRRVLRPMDWGEIWPELINDAHPWPPSATDPTEQQAA